MENQDQGQGLDGKKIADFFGKNIRYISAGVILIILVVVLAVTVTRSNQAKENPEQGNSTEGEQIPQGEDQEQGEPQGEEPKQDENQGTETFAEDAIPEINTLMQNYYTAYASGDVAALEAYVTPLSDAEKGYIGVMSQYVTAYENIHCYTKKGMAEGEYAVSVATDMCFEGTENKAPGLSFFYIRTNESGAYYIDNIYSPFNLERRETELDSQVEAFIKEYEAQEDVASLGVQIQQKYEEALAADETLSKIVNETIPQAMQTMSQEQPKEPSEEEGEQPKKDENQQAQDEQPKEDENEQPAEAEEPQPEENESTSETVYAVDNINIRKEAREDSEKVGSALIGESFKRTGTTEDGWSAIEYGGSKAYVKSEYLSTEKPEVPQDNTQSEENQDQGESNDGGINYVPEGKTLTLNDTMNIRKSMSEDAEKVGTAAPGDTVTVILSYKEGWTKVDWNGTTGYIRTDLLLNN